MTQTTTTDEIPDEQYDALYSVFETAIENDLYLIVRDGVYAELAEWYGCEGADLALQEWMDEMMMDEMAERYTIETDSDNLRLYTEHFRAHWSIQRGGYGGSSLSHGTASHLEMDEFEWDCDEVPWINGAGREAEEVLREMDRPRDNYDTRWY